MRTFIAAITACFILAPALASANCNFFMQMLGRCDNEQQEQQQSQASHQRYFVSIPDGRDVCIEIRPNAWVLYGLGNDCASIDEIIMDATLIEGEANETENDNPGQQQPGECAWPLGHKEYCAACGPCDIGEGMCFRSWHCKKGLVCDVNTNKCKKR